MMSILLRALLGLTLLAAGAPAWAGSSTYPVGSVAACDGVTDDTAAIRGLIASVPTGAVIEFPSYASCRLTGALVLERAVSLVGYHSTLFRTDVHPLCDLDTNGEPILATCGSHVDGAVIAILASHVLVQGLTLRGQAYGTPISRNTHGVWAIGPAFGKVPHIVNVTVRDVRVERMRGRGISLVRVDDFIVEDNHIEDVGYAGIFAESVRRGAIRRNHVEDIDDPETCEGQPAPCRVASSYGIVVTGGAGVPMSEDVLVLDNHVRENEIWGGIMNHGGVRVLIADNEVLDTNFSYANTSAGQPSSHVAFVNNFGDILPTSVGGRYDLNPNNPWGEGLWFHAAPGPPAEDLVALGNELRNTGGGNTDAGISAWHFEGGRFVGNTVVSTFGVLPPRSAIRLRNFGKGGVAYAHIARNQLQADEHGIWSTAAPVSWSTVAYNVLLAGQAGFVSSTGGQWSVYGNDFSAALAPSKYPNNWGPVLTFVLPPTGLAASGTGPGRCSLTWTYGGGSIDGFYIEGRRFGTSWEPMAYRPSAAAAWAFDAPSNPFWVPFDGTRYIVEDLLPGYWQFRIRALWGSGGSPWSPLAGTWVL